MLRKTAAVVCIGWVAAGASLPTLHAHVYADHDHPEHRHGLAFHEHRHQAHPATAADAFQRARVAPCEPDEHVVSMRATIVKTHDRVVCLPSSVARPVEPVVAHAAWSARLDVRAHSPPRLTDGPLRAPPAPRPA